MSISIKTTKNGKKLVITMPLEQARLSATGKTNVIASSRGAKSDEATFDGKPIFVVANAWVYREDAESKKVRKKNRSAATVDEEQKD